MPSSNEPIKLLDFLSRELILQAPHYQRRFKWGTKELEELWRDIQEVFPSSDTSALFLGAIILRHAQTSSGTSAERWTIIDGQQRLTTLSLAILALCLECEADSAKHDKITLEEASNFVSDVLKTYLLPQRSGNVKALDTKVMVTTPDLAEYRRAISESSLSDQAKRFKRPGGANPKIPAALRFHREQWRKFLGSSPTLHDYEVLLERFVGKIELVEIQLGDRHDPNEVFNRLNTSGTKLTIGDLIRNEAFENLSSSATEASDAYDAYWAPFEARFSTEELREDYFWPFTLAVDSTATQKQALNKLRARWRTLEKTQSGHSTDAAISIIVDDLNTFVDAYLLLTEGRPIDGLSPKIHEAALQLARMKPASVTHSFLIQLLEAARHGEVNVTDAVQTLMLVESFLVRRALIGQEPTGLHAVFKTLWSNSKGDPIRVRSGLKTQTVDFATDDEVRLKLPTVNFYRRKLCRYVMGEYERSIRRGDPLTDTQLGSGMHIDHLAPQSMVDEWKDRHGLSADEATTLLNCWGNLAPLSKEANSSKGASDWPSARNKLLNESIYKTTQEVLANHSDWTPKHIRERTLALTTWALKRWPLPSQ